LLSARSTIEKQFARVRQKGRGEEKPANIDGIPTGSLSLDIRGALRLRHSSRCAFIESSARIQAATTLTSAHLATPRWRRAAFIDAEHASTLWAKRLVVNLDYLLVSQPDTG